MSTIILDLDHTLLNSQKLKKELASIMGISQILYDESYKKRFYVENEPYSFDKHIKYLQNIGIIEKGEEIFLDVRKKFEQKLSTLSEFLHEGALDVIKNIGDVDDEKILTTFGNEEWQEEKLKKLPELEPFFSKIFFEKEDKGKSDILKVIGNKNERVLIVNDNVEETKKMVEIVGKEKCDVKIIKSIHSESEADKELALKMGFEFYDNISELSLEYNEVFQEVKLGESNISIK
jgi:FMN phosphatase YigB (HAD superfamily)